jgi:hypothetical protein
MAPQLAINQGPQDALLYDNSRSYFTNVGYVRTSNFQVEYIDVDSQNAAQFGTTVNFVIPKAADLLGPVDLICDIDLAQNPPNSFVTFGTTPWGDKDSGMICTELVDEIGYAMIERITFSVGSNDIGASTD